MDAPQLFTAGLAESGSVLAIQRTAEQSGELGLDVLDRERIGSR